VSSSARVCSGHQWPRGPVAARFACALRPNGRRLRERHPPRGRETRRHRDVPPPGDRRFMADFRKRRAAGSWGSVRAPPSGSRLPPAPVALLPAFLAGLLAAALPVTADPRILCLGAVVLIVLGAAAAAPRGPASPFGAMAASGGLAFLAGAGAGLQNGLQHGDRLCGWDDVVVSAEADAPSTPERVVRLEGWCPADPVRTP